MKTRLIFVEGLPGSGKSTTAQYLARQLCLAGHDAAWVYESGQDHPVPFSYSPADHASPEHFVERCLAAWTEFARVAQHSPVISVMDGALLQTPLFGLMLHDVSRELMLELARNTLAAVERLAPKLVRLEAEDIELAMVQACSRRYAGLLELYVQRNQDSPYGRSRGLSGLHGLTRFWQAFREFCDRAVALLGVEETKLLVAADQGHRTGPSILQRLAVAPVPDLTLAPPALSAYAGRYEAPSGDASFAIDVAGSELVARGPSPYLWEAGTTLLPRGAHAFEARSRPARLCFQLERGSVTGVELTASIAGLGAGPYFLRKVG